MFLNSLLFYERQQTTPLLLHYFVIVQQQGNMDGGRVYIVGGLTHIQVIMRFNNMVFSFFLSTHFKCNIGKHFVGIHVGGCSGTTLV